MRERRDIVLFYLSVALLVLTTLVHEWLDPPTSMPDWVSSIAYVGAVIFMVAMTVFVFHPQIRRTSSTLSMLNATVNRMKLLETVIESADDGIVITDANLDQPGPHITYVNEAFTKISGYSREEVIGRSPRFLQNEFTKRETLDAMKVALREGNPFKSELLNSTKEGKHYWLEISIVPVRDAQGTITHFAAIERDITKRKAEENEYKGMWVQLKRANLKAEAATKELQESLHRAEEANKAKSNFLANMSHELRTPMNGVLGMAQLLADTPLDTDQRELVTTINSSGEGLLMLLNDILDFSKIEAGALQLEAIAYPCKYIMQQTLQLLTPNADKKGIKLLVDIDENIPEYMRGDAGRVRQIVTNLVGNSIKFTHAGYVRLSARMQEVQGKEALHVRVEDTGIGIPQEKISAIFEKFTQADASVTRKYGGTGLGLAITKQLVTLMGGEIGVESVAGKGSTFWFSIPCVIAHPADIDHHKKHAESYIQRTVRKPIAQAKALLVEDYPVNQVFAQKLLKKFGFTQIDLAENGSEALLKYREHGYDVIFMDCQMPEIDGYQATQKIREIEAGTPLHTSIIAMTANAMMGDREKCLKVGMDDYISKPLRAEHLQAILQGLFILEDAATTPSTIKKPITVSPAEDEAPAVDLEQLRVFTNGDPEEEKALGELFIEQAREMIAILKANMADQLRHEWKSAAHRFKGASGNLGATKLYHLCKRAEQHFEDNAQQKHDMLAIISAEAKRVEAFFG